MLNPSARTTELADLFSDGDEETVTVRSVKCFVVMENLMASFLAQNE
jgi:hypothetical protein